MRFIKLVVKKMLSRFGYEIHRIVSGIPASTQHVFIPDTICASSVKEAEYYTQWSPRHPLFTPWVGYPDFQKMYQGVEPYTLVTPERCHLLMSFARHARHIEGDFAECGVYRGGTALILARVLKECPKTLYLFDSFQGLPKENREYDNYFRQGDFSDGSSEAVHKLLQGVHDRIHIQEGWIPQSFDGLEDTRYAFVHVDTDLYQSAWDCCEFFYPRLAPGGIMLFDDYGFPACRGEKDAVDLFFTDKRETPIALISGQGLLMKL